MNLKTRSFLKSVILLGLIFVSIVSPSIIYIDNKNHFFFKKIKKIFNKQYLLIEYSIILLNGGTNEIRTHDLTFRRLTTTNFFSLIFFSNPLKSIYTNTFEDFLVSYNFSNFIYFLLFFYVFVRNLLENIKFSRLKYSFKSLDFTMFSNSSSVRFELTYDSHC